MATRIRTNGSRTVPEAGPTGTYAGGPQADLTRAQPPGLTSFPWTTAYDSVEPVDEGKFARVSPTGPVEFWSERVATEFTLSGSVTFATVCSPSSGWSGKLRCRLYKITAGGSAIRTLIVTATSNTFTTSTQQIFSATPPTPVVVSRGERLILIITLVEHNATGTLTLRSNNSDLANTYVELTETITMLDNITKLYMRRTSVSGISTFFDLLSAQGASAATTGVRNTSAGATELQWTRTAGGTVLEWISPRVKEPFFIASLDYLGLSVWASESNLNANATYRAKFFHRAPDGTETLVSTMSRSIELSTTVGNGTWPTSFTGVHNQTMAFREDDRLVVRLYVINVGTMAGSQTATVFYDHNASNVSGDTWVTVAGVFTFKAEADPARSEVVPSGASTLGLGNGQ